MPNDDSTGRPRGFELYYSDTEGNVRDAELWNEILGADDQHVIQLEDLSDATLRTKRVLHVSPGEVKHGPLEERLVALINVIQAAFAEHNPLSVGEWQEGFCRDAVPETEIALWFRAAKIYQTFVGDEHSPERRRDIYRCLVACMVSTPTTVWSVLLTGTLTHEETATIVAAYFDKS